MKAVGLYKNTFINFVIPCLYSNCSLTDPHVSNYVSFSARQFCVFAIPQVKRYFLTSTLHCFSSISTYAY